MSEVIVLYNSLTVRDVQQYCTILYSTVLYFDTGSGTTTTEFQSEDGPDPELREAPSRMREGT